ncbi:MAG: hypothetical protein JO211_03925 [Acidobacteriaceae bacterium]|nr:hypothetical protein [Acidobacteriaceae bacterium]
MESQAREAVESDLPYPAAFGQDGELIPGLSAEFTAWVQSHKTTTDEAGRKAALEFPARVAYLGISGDARAIPLLRRALRSRDYLIQVQASEALVELNDKSSIPAIIDACTAAPAKAAMPIAAPLARFDDITAREAAKHFNPPVQEQPIVKSQ